MEQSKNNLRDDENKSRHSEDQTAANSDHQNIAPNRGGTTDMGSEQLSRAGGARGSAGSSATTKRSVTGSDYDGQVSE